MTEAYLATWEEAADGHAREIALRAADMNAKFPTQPDSWVDAFKCDLGYLKAGHEPASDGFMSLGMTALEWLVERQHRVEQYGHTVDADCFGFEADVVVDTICSKQHDYGHENINAFGRHGLIVRISDKIARFENLTKRDVEPSNESLRDTVADIFGYCVVGLMYEDGTFQLPLARDTRWVSVADLPTDMAEVAWAQVRAIPNFEDVPPDTDVVETYYLGAAAWDAHVIDLVQDTFLDRLVEFQVRALGAIKDAIKQHERNWHE